MDRLSEIPEDQAHHPYGIGFCGTGSYSVRCAQALAQDERFQVRYVVTPAPTPQGRKQTLTPSPLHQWAQTQNIPVYLVEKSLKDLQTPLLTAPAVDFLVVVSFGYLLPAWLLELPHLAPINVHPSALPLYRGSAPGQFALLYGETNSAVSIMKMNTKFDQGEILAQIPFPLSPDTTQTRYYDEAFLLAQRHLPSTLVEYAQTQIAQPQPSAPDNSPLARRLQRQDGFLAWSVWQAAQRGQAWPTLAATDLGPALHDLFLAQPELQPAQLIDRAVRAFSPWPGVWTLAPIYKNKTAVRLKILAGELQNGRYQPTEVQYEGEAPSAPQPRQLAQ